MPRPNEPHPRAAEKAQGSDEADSKAETPDPQPLPHGHDIKAFGAPHDYAYAPSVEERSTPEYLAYSDEVEAEVDGDERDAASIAED